MSMNLVTLLYLLASVCFIQALKGLSHPTTARRGNAFGMTGMAIAAVTTVALIYKLKAEVFAGTESGASTGFILIFAGLIPSPTGCPSHRIDTSRPHRMHEPWCRPPVLTTPMQSETNYSTAYRVCGAVLWDMPILKLSKRSPSRSRRWIIPQPFSALRRQHSSSPSG